MFNIADCWHPKSKRILCDGQCAEHIRQECFAEERRNEASLSIPIRTIGRLPLKTTKVS